LERIGSALRSKSKDQFMSPQRRARIIGLLGGFAAGLANASFYLARSMDNTPLWGWILRGGIQYTLFTFPVGAALAGFLGAWGAVRWRSMPVTILVILVASFLGAIISVPGSHFLVCHYWDGTSVNSETMSCFGTMWLMVETPVMWILLAIMTALLALLVVRF
jgi:hypothetical protein